MQLNSVMITLAAVCVSDTAARSFQYHHNTSTQPSSTAVHNTDSQRVSVQSVRQEVILVQSSVDNVEANNISFKGGVKFVVSGHNTSDTVSGPNISVEDTQSVVSEHISSVKVSNSDISEEVSGNNVSGEVSDKISGDVSDYNTSEITKSTINPRNAFHGNKKSTTIYQKAMMNTQRKGKCVSFISNTSTVHEANVTWAVTTISPSTSAPLVRFFWSWEAIMLVSLPGMWLVLLAVLYFLTHSPVGKKLLRRFAPPPDDPNYAERGHGIGYIDGSPGMRRSLTDAEVAAAAQDEGEQAAVNEETLAAGGVKNRVEKRIRIKYAGEETAEQAEVWTKESVSNTNTISNNNNSNNNNTEDTAAEKKFLRGSPSLLLEEQDASENQSQRVRKLSLIQEEVTH
ncbi:uncharacterized protein [Cherax quadricarinatus]